MTNGSTIDSIEAILTGEEPLPTNVNNRLLLAAIRVNYQKNQEIEAKYDGLVKCWQECKDDIDNLDTAMQVRDSRMDAFRDDLKELAKVSGRWDKLLAVGALLGTAIGSLFGSK